jgi:hypothetical protein
MGFYKDAYIRELERVWALLEAEGLPTDKAYQEAGNVAYYNMHKILAQRLIDEEDND